MSEEKDVVIKRDVPEKPLSINQLQGYVSEQQDKAKSGKLEQETRKLIKDSFKNIPVSVATPDMRERFIAAGIDRLPNSPYKLLLMYRIGGASHEKIVELFKVADRGGLTGLEIVKLMEKEAISKVKDALSGL